MSKDKGILCRFSFEETIKYVTMKGALNQSDGAAVYRQAPHKQTMKGVRYNIEVTRFTVDHGNGYHSVFFFGFCIRDKYSQDRSGT